MVIGSLGNTYENNVLDAILGVGFTKPATVYVALFTVTPSDAGGGTEVTGGAYGRVAVTNNATNWPAASSSTKSNGTVITFPTSTAAWGSVVAWGLFTASTGGTLIVWGALSTAKTIGVSDAPNFPVGSLVIVAD